jgi:hypothetical protein
MQLRQVHLLNLTNSSGIRLAPILLTPSHVVCLFFNKHSSRLVQTFGTIPFVFTIAGSIIGKKDVLHQDVNKNIRF